MQKSLALEYNLQFFAKEGPGGEKTEEATGKKLEKAREEGQVAKSKDLITAVMLMILFLGLKFFGGYMYNRFQGVFTEIYSKIPEFIGENFTLGMAASLFSLCLKETLLIALPIFAFGIVGAIVINAVQIKWKITGKPLKPKFNRISPLSGLKKMFSVSQIFELIKTIGKLLILFYVIYDALKDEWGLLTNIYQLNFISAVQLLAGTVLNLAVKISVVFLIIAFVDYIYQKRKFKKEMRMTKQEVKEEYKQVEGNPQIKSQIKRKMMEASRRRMMQGLPEADVVITNPTHLAVAIKYDKDVSDAPVVIAKGADYLANKIKETAKEHEIEIVENKPVARMLYHNVEIGEQIPPELYQMVAEILAYVYGLKNKL